MFNNGVGGISDVLNFQDIVQGPEKQQHKNYFVEQSLFRSDKAITFHTSEVLCQVEGSEIPEGGWVGVDTWFGSITIAIEVYKKCKVRLTWVIKNKFIFPMEVKYEIIKERHKKTMGH